MSLLHGLITGSGELAVWAEDPGLPRAATGREHPFAVPLDLGAPGVVTVLLPSDEHGPVASFETGTLLRPWRVPVCLVDAEFFEDPGEHELGSSAAYLADVAAYATNLVARGRFLPSVVDGSQARWLPALSGVDSARFAALREAMPPACRAEQVEPELLDGRGSEQVLTVAVNSLVDSQVRAALGRFRLTPPRRGRVAAADRAVESWLTALTGDPEVTADPALAGKLAAWRASGINDNPVRLCFRLRSPEQTEYDHDDAEGGWLLEFGLQAVDEPSVLVGADQVWRAADNVLLRWIEQPQEQLLADLGRASRLYPALDHALREAKPVELRMNTAGAHEFLSRSALLVQAGFGVMVPARWRQPHELGLRLEVDSPGAAGVVAQERGFALKVLVDYRWQLAIGDQPLTEGELAELARAKVPLVRIRGEWLHLDQERLDAGLEFLRRYGSGRMNPREVLFRAEHETPLPVNEVTGTGWLADLVSGKAERLLEPVPTPEGFTGTLRPYQRRGLAWLAFLDRLGLGACLADDMGLGKTVQLLALEAMPRSGPTLLVCPMSVIGNWQREAARFTPGLSVHAHHGENRLPGRELGRYDLVITTYATATKDAANLSTVDWDRLVLDEAQNIKNSASAQSRAIRALPARNRIALTGTPVENRLAELWSVLDFVNPGMLGSVHTFRARYGVPVERFADAEAATRLRRATGPFILRRLKTDPSVIDDLPEKLELRQLCNLTTEQASLYRAVVDQMLDRIATTKGFRRKGLVLATMSKLKQVCNHPAQFLGDGSPVAGRSGKVARLEDILTEVLADGDKALCFTQFTEFGDLLVPHLRARFDTEVLYLHGGTSQRDRDAMVQRFQSPGGPPIFLLSLKAGGTGLNLSAANHVIHLDRWWNPAVEDQATDRAFRIGQRRDVQVRKFVCVGTLEERVDEMITQKRALAQLAVGAGEDWLTELSTGQLRELFALSQEAVGD
ncbi:DEAD/DEAH box helicase [Kutzneria albida]|uniref:Snf2/Rad54 family helicase n=1 Tax=Kutzneria albida DSM 43870 TaxID=1449976 RepID=W5W3Q4_9PSEU|nr:DEAD/DEAH box helicase [Kutzneria albida]AHH95848.1 Snf2/Rad54 family helicase [Kutzneria albida DSM 43870]